MKKTMLLGLAALLAVLGTRDAQAAPNTVTFTGRLSTGSGPVDGSVSIMFIVYDAAVGGSSHWTDTLTLTADQGLVFATLGSVANPLDGTVFDGGDRYLEIHVGSETLSPRLPINSVPYAIHSGSAELADHATDADNATHADSATNADHATAADSATNATNATNASTLGGTITAANVVTGVTAGAGLSGGGAGGNLSLAVDTATVQSRVTGTCASGAISTINANGTVSCTTPGAEVDGVIGNEVTNATDASLTRSGAGTAASPYTLGVNFGATGTVQHTLTSNCAVGSSIRAIATDGTVTCQTGITTEVDGVVGNEVTAATDATLTRSGAGTAASPYTLGVNTAVMQRVLTGACAVGSSIRAIDTNGNVTCQTDNTGITTEADGVIGNEVTNATDGTLTRSGAGTTASPFTLGVNTAVMQRVLTGSCAVGSSIRAIDTSGNVTCQASPDIVTHTNSTAMYLPSSTCVTNAAHAITITAPAAGTIEVDANVWVSWNHTLNAGDQMVLTITNVATDCQAIADWGSAWVKDIPSAYPTASMYDMAYYRRTFTVAAAGTYTYYIGGYMAYGGAANTDNIWWESMTAKWYP